MVDFGPPAGPEQAGLRPAVIMQDNALSPALTTVLVVPLTTNLRRLQAQPTVLLEAGEAELPRDSVALCFQLQARGKTRLVRRVGLLSAEALAAVEDGVLNAIGA
jgi:mRNA interferase MazF